MENNVLLISSNFYPEPTGVGRYNGEMIEWLSSNGYHCTVITSYPYYPFWKVQSPYDHSYWFKKEIKDFSNANESPVEIYRCPQYVPENPSGFRRVLLDLTFSFSSFLVLIKLLFRKRYEYVISVAPCFQSGLLALLYKKIRGTKFFYHIQDLQIDAAKELQMVKSDLLINLLLKVEAYILKHADIVSSISVGMIERVKLKHDREVVFYPNWTDIKAFFPIENKAELKVQFGFSATDKIVLYSGAVGEKQGLENVLLSAKRLEGIPNLKFVICGSGPYLKKLQELMDDMDLHNIRFVPLQPSEKLNRFLNIADVHLIIQKANASDLVMPSKLTNILAIGGLSIVTAPVDSSLYRIVKRNNIGLSIVPENEAALTECIQSAFNTNNDLIRKNARKYAEQYLSIEKVMTKFSVHFQEEPKINLIDILEKFWVRA